MSSKWVLAIRSHLTFRESSGIDFQINKEPITVISLTIIGSASLRLAL